MKENFACKLLYSDTDSLTYAIMTEDLYADLKNNPTLSLKNSIFRTTLRNQASTTRPIKRKSSNSKMNWQDQ